MNYRLHFKNKTKQWKLLAELLKASRKLNCRVSSVQPLSPYLQIKEILLEIGLIEEMITLKIIKR